MLPFAARQHFLEHGYAVLPNVLSPEVAARLRAAALASTLARSRYFADLPNIHDLLKAQTARRPDPVAGHQLTHLEKRRFLLHYYRQRQRQKNQLRRTATAFLKGRDISQLSGPEMWKLSELLSRAALKLKDRGCSSTVRNDPQMLAAINEYRANAWMTNAALEAVLRDVDGFVRPLSQVIEIVGGVEKPVIFGDAPLLREAYGNPVGYHCTAPLIGTRTNGPVGPTDGSAAAVSVVVFTYTPSPLCLAPYVMQHSHHAVRAQYLRSVRPERMRRQFAPMEADVRDQLRHFAFEDSVTGVSLLSPPAAASAAGGGASTSAASSTPPLIAPGTVMVVDPHLMTAFGANFTAENEVVYRLNVVAEKARPFLPSPSWIRGWRTMPQDISFASPVVFPPLHVDE